MPTAIITEADVDGFRDRLDEWGASLSAGEQAVLHMVLVRAFPPPAADREPQEPDGSESDVVGFAGATVHKKGKPTPSDIPFTHPYDKSSPILGMTGPGLGQLIGMPYPFDGPGTLG